MDCYKSKKDSRHFGLIFILICIQISLFLDPSFRLPILVFLLFSISFPTILCFLLFLSYFLLFLCYCTFLFNLPFFPFFLTVGVFFFFHATHINNSTHIHLLNYFFILILPRSFPDQFGLFPLHQSSDKARVLRTDDNQVSYVVPATTICL